MGSKGNQVSTNQNQSYTPNPVTAATGYQSLGMAQYDVTAPFSMPAAPVAGFNPTQQQAFGEISNIQGMAQPYFNTGQSYLQQSAAPVTGADVANYYNPMAANVTAQMQNIFGQQQRNITGQLTQDAGGVGADRIAVGQSELANQQGLAAGQTYAGLYQQALNAAEAQKQMAAGAGYGIAQMGPAAQGAQLQDISALLGAGGQQQQLSQQQLNALYQQQLASIAYPYQQAQFLAGITGGLAPALGGTTAGYGQTTYPTPSPFAQIAGLGTAGLGALGAYYGAQGARGGRVMADGGGVDDMPPASMFPGTMPIRSAGTVIPHISMPMGGGRSGPAGQFMAMHDLPMQIPGMPQNKQGTVAGGISAALPAAIPGLIKTADRLQDAQEDATEPPDAYDAQGGAVKPMGADVITFPVPPKPDRFDPRYIGTDNVKTFPTKRPIELPLDAYDAQGGAVEPMSYGQGFDDGGDVALPPEITTGQSSGLGAADRDAAIKTIYGEAADQGPVGQAAVAHVIHNRLLDGSYGSSTSAVVRAPHQFEPWSTEAGRARMNRISKDDYDRIGGIVDNTFAGKGDDPTGGATHFYAPGLQARLGRAPPAWDDGTGQQIGDHVFFKPGDGGGVRATAQDGDSDAAPMAFQGRQPGDTTAPPPVQGPMGSTSPTVPYPDALKRDWGQQAARSPWMALVKAGAQMATTVGPIGSVIGQGIKAGVGELEEQRKALTTEEAINQKAQQLQDMAQYHREHIGILHTGEDIKRQELEYKKQILGAGLIDQDALNDMATSYRSGNTGVLQNLGRGTQGPINIKRFWDTVETQLKAEGKGGKDLAAAKAGFTADLAESRTLGVRAGNIETAVEEMRRFVPLALTASDNLSRGPFVPWTKAVQMVQAGTSSPELGKFVAANRALINAYAQAISRTGITTVHAQDAAEKMLSTATSPEAYRAVVGQLELEANEAIEAPSTVRDRITRRISGETSGKADKAPDKATVPSAATPTSADRDYVKAHPEARGKFIKQFGVEP